MSQPKDGATEANSAGATKADPKDTAKGTKTPNDSKKKPLGRAASSDEARNRIRFQARTTGRTSIRDYEHVELVEGRLDPLLQVFWQEEYTFQKK